MKAASQTAKSEVTPKNVTLSPVRLKQQTFERLTGLLDQVNAKGAGRKVRADELVSLALSLVGEAQIKRLQDRSLTNQDRFDAMYKEHVAKKGSISKDAFLGLLLSGKIARCRPSDAE